MNNNIETSDILFFLIFRNKYLRTEITRHLLLYKNYFKVHVNSINELIYHQYREYISKLYYNSNEPLQKGLIPSSVTSLTFSFKFNQIINVGDLSNNIKILKFKSKNSNGFNKSITPPINSIGRIIPEGVEILYLEAFNQKLNKNDIPNSITQLYIPNYNQDLNEFVLPHTNLRILDFGQKFNKQLSPNSIPKSVVDLSLSDSYNFALSMEYLPPNLEILSLGYYYNKQINENDIPKSLQKLNISSDYSYNLPQSIKVITEYY